MTTANVQLPPLYTLQRGAFFNDARYSVTEASTKAGKTVGAIVWQADRVLKDTMQRQHWWIAPIYKQAKIAWRRAARMFRGLCRANETELTLTFRNGAVWSFKTAEKPDNLYGEDVASAVFDEYTRAREEAWWALRSTVTATEAPIRFIGNVRGRGWGYQIARKAENGEAGWHYSRITADDAVEAGVLTQAEIDDAERTLPDWVFRELYYCEPADDGGNPFGIAHIEACIGPMSEEAPVVFGVDLARKVDWTVCVGIDAEGRVCSFDRWQRVPWGETQRRLARIIGGVPALVDATGVGDPVVEQLGLECPYIDPFVFTPKSKQQLMEGLTLAIQSRAVVYPAGPIRNELDVFEFRQKGASYYYSAPDGMHDDCVMALALAVQAKADMLGSVPLISAGAYEQEVEDDEGWDRWD